MSFLTARTVTGLFPFGLWSFKSISGRGTATVLTVHSELPFKFSDPCFKLSHRFFKTLNCLFLALDDRDECFRVLLCQCKDLVTYHGSMPSTSICLS